MIKKIHKASAVESEMPMVAITAEEIRDLVGHYRSAQGKDIKRTQQKLIVKLRNDGLSFKQISDLFSKKFHRSISRQYAAKVFYKVTGTKPVPHYYRDRNPELLKTRERQDTSTMSVNAMDELLKGK